MNCTQHQFLWHEHINRYRCKHCNIAQLFSSYGSFKETALYKHYRDLNIENVEIMNACRVIYETIYKDAKYEKHEGNKIRIAILYLATKDLFDKKEIDKTYSLLHILKNINTLPLFRYDPIGWPDVSKILFEIQKKNPNYFQKTYRNIITKYLINDVIQIEIYNKYPKLMDYYELVCDIYDRISYLYIPLTLPTIISAILAFFGKVNHLEKYRKVYEKISYFWEGPPSIKVIKSVSKVNKVLTKRSREPSNL